MQLASGRGIHGKNPGRATPGGMERHMEHRHEMKNELSSKDYFLKRDLVEYEKPNIYSLEAEFAKTKRNRDFRPYMVFFGFILLVALSTVAVANYLEIKSKQVNIDISDFEDLRLKETLSAATELGNELDRKTEELTSLQTSYQTEITKLKREIQLKTKTSAETNKGSQSTALTKEKKRLETLQKKYEKQIAQKQAEITRIQKESKIENQDIEDYRRYYQLELKKQKDYYENKLKNLDKSNKQENESLKERQKKLLDELNQFKEVFEDEQLAELSSPIVSGGATLVLNTYRKELQQEKVLERSAFKKMRAKINQLTAIMKKLQMMPDSNPAGPPLKQTNALANSLINDYEKLWFSLTDRVSQKNLQLGSYQYGLTAFLKEKHATGCIIDPRQDEKPVIFYLKNWEPDTETIVALYRGKDEYLGKLKLIPSEAGARVQVMEMATNKKIQPLDWFRLQVD
jgi:hypothetical protein